MPECICDVCGKKVESVELRTTNYYEEIKHRHKIQKKPTKPGKDIICFYGCYKCRQKHRGKKMFGCTSGLIMNDYDFKN